MSHHQHHYGNNFQRDNSYGRVGGRQGGGEGISYGDWRGGGRDGGRGGDRGRGGNRGRGRISGGRYWSDRRQELEREGIVVKTNCFRLIPVPNHIETKNEVIHQYVVKISLLAKKRQVTISKDSAYTPKVEETHAQQGKVPSYLIKIKEITMSKTNPEDDRSTMFSRRVLNHCQHKLQEVSPHQSFIHDGTNIAYSRLRLDPVKDKKLYLNYQDTFEYRENDDAIQEDNEKEAEMQLSKKQKTQDDIVEYIVSITVNSDEDDSDTTAKKGWYLISFQHVGIVSTNLSADGKAMLPVVNCINTALKGNMISHCIGFGRSPHMYFFRPPKEQEAILPPFLKEKLYNSIIPLLGLKQSVRYCTNSIHGLLLVADFGVRYMYNDINAKTKEPFRVLQIDPHGNRQSATIANTIKIQNVHNYIPPGVRPDLEKRLQKVNFHIQYYRGGQYENKLRARQRKQQMEEQSNQIDAKTSIKETAGNLHQKPLTDDQIEKMKYFLKKNQRLLESTPDGPSIIWEPNTYTFPYVSKERNEKKSGLKVDHNSALANTSPGISRQITVEIYFREQYQYQLKYPMMPLIRVKSRHENMKEYYPLEFLLQCPDEVKNMNTEEQLNDGLRLGDEFCGIRRIQKISSLVQSTNSQYNPLQAFQQGQSNVLQKEFQLALGHEPISVQANVLEEPKLKNTMQPVKLVDGSLTLHGHFEVPSTLNTFAVLNYTNETNQRLWDRCFEGLFKYCKSRGMKVSDDLNLQTFPNVFVKEALPRTFNEMHGHFDSVIKNAQKSFLANRRAVDVQNMSGVAMKCDVKLSEQYPDQYVNVWPHSDRCLREGVPLNRVDCPSIIFIVLPDGAASQIYSNAKLLSHVDFAVQSQVMLWSKVSKDNNTQYLSNMSFKLNLKLATAFGKETAWRRSNGWMEEVPTLILGISMASASGQDSLMTVVGTVLLDNIGLNHKQELCVQKKSSLIAEKTIIEIVKSLGILWSRCNGGQTPERVIIYRLTGDDGMFEDIIGTELKAAKSAFHELNKNLPGDTYNCSHCNRSGCIFCLPKITMVVAQSQHNIIFAPTGEGAVNVPSGTCVEGLFPALSLSDDQKMSGLLKELHRQKSEASHDALFSASHDGNSAFALVAHGGLKGTSKCVIYRVIWNENLLFMPKSSSQANSLTLSEIQKLTYHLSFQYGTAPKAPRLPTVLQYSVRLNKIAIGYAHSLRDRIKFKGECEDPDAVFTAILRRVRGTNSDPLEPFAIPFHTTSMG